MRMVLFLVGISFSIAPCAWAEETTPEEEAMKILSLGWGGQGRRGNWGNVPTCSLVLECSKRTYCSFCAFLCNEMKGSSSPLAEGNFRSAGKRLVRWDCQSFDGKTGRVIIDGKQYDLVKGSLFLIVAKNDKTTVYQFQADLTKMPKDSIELLNSEQSERQPKIRAVLKDLGLVK